MPKRKTLVDKRLQREKERDRKRQQRQKSASDNVPPIVTNFSVPCGTEDGACLAPPGNFPGLGSMGCPPKEEKPLARVQASPRVKMHSPALRLPSPQGSRLFVREQYKAPSPDSPPWVCAPPRAPGPDTVHVSGPAGQAQLETSMDGGTSRKTKDEGNLRINKKETERKTNRNEKEQNEKHISDIDIERDLKKRNADQCSTRPGNENYKSLYRSVQGSFHQADPLFQENSGTQCVANCLAGLAYHKLKNANFWKTVDMDKVLITGDELYTYLQRSSTINDRYLLVEELPELFECFNHSYKFHANESITTVVMADDNLNYADFNALPLDDAIQIALTDTDGCFVCFGGNTLLIGRTESGFFAFDSHSRSVDGMCSVTGKSTRVLLKDLKEVYSHLQNLALSMGISRGVECNLTSVSCKMISFTNTSCLFEDREDMGILRKEQLTIEGTAKTPEENDLLLIGSDTVQYAYFPLDATLKKQLCENLNIPFISIDDSHIIQCIKANINKPLLEKAITGDGNCFFRAISFSLTNSEDFHNIIRNAVCAHMIKNKNLFKPFLRDGLESVDCHLSSTRMLKEGTWATEVEIFATAHLLNVDIYTYSGGCWLRFSVSQIETGVQSRTGAIYLNHHQLNHYNVVLSVTGEELDLTPMQQYKHPKEYKKRYHNRTRMKLKRQSTTEIQGSSCAEKRKNSQRKRYHSDVEFREKKLNEAFVRYFEDKKFQANLRRASKERYQNDIEYQNRTKKRINIKYSKNEKHKENVKRKSIAKYEPNKKHRKCVKKRSIEKYAKDEQHRNEVKMRSIQKYATDTKHRENVKAKSNKRYKVDKKHRLQVNIASTKKYRENKIFREKKLLAAVKNYELNDLFRLKRKASSKDLYDSSSTIKTEKKERVKYQRLAKQAVLENQDEVVKVFKAKAMQGNDYSCCCCDRLLFQNQVQRCERNTYAKNDQAANVAEMCIQDKYCHQCTDSCPENCIWSKLWICYTCHRKILTGNIPAEAAFNKMALEDIPEELKQLNSLEKHLIAIHIPFMKVFALPHGGQQNIHGPVVCVPSDLRKVTRLPMKPEDDLLLRVKLKRKLNYKGYVEYQFVDPNHVFEALGFLKQNNHWYKDVSIDTNWKGNVENDQEISGNGDLLSDDDDPQNIATDTCLQPVDIAQEVLDHYFDDIYNIAPGEGNNPVRMLQEPGNEAKTFPYLFPSGCFSWNDNRDTRITLSRYFNNRLMNTDDRFAKDSNYIFFSQFMSDLNQVIEKTQISIRKSVKRLGTDENVTAKMVQNPEVLSKLMKNDEALRFMQPIRGTPAYWSAAQKDLFAMLRQLGIPTWFCSFSAAEHRWNDAVATILRQQYDSRDPCNMDWSEKNEVLKSNPVTVARMFEHRFHLFQTEVIFSPSEPIGKVSDFFQRVEFQQRGSPHMHCLYWIENAPKLNEHGEDAVCEFIDKYVSCAVPSEKEDAELRNIVLAVQQHSKKHSKSCRKKGTDCRFNFPRPPSSCTFISSLQEEENDGVNDLKQEHSNAKEILLQVWNNVQEIENESDKTEDVLEQLGLTQSQNEEAHKRLAKKRSVVLRRHPYELWINQYNPCLLKAWDANMDIQFVLDPFSCIVYIISYISKSEREMGMVLKQTKIEAIEAEEGNESARTTLKKIGSAYLNHREVSAQEAVYRVCNLKMKECSRKVVFIPVGENPTRLTKPLSQLEKKQKTKGDDSVDNDDDEEDIWMTNIIERYENRPSESTFQNMCLAEFCSEFRVLAKSQVPKTLNENVFELQNSKGFVRRRTRTKPAVIRYPRFNAEKMPEKYYQSVLQLFLPYWTVTHLKPPGFDTYEIFYENGHVRISGKSALQSVKTIVDTNRTRYAQNEELLEEAQETFENIGEPEDAWAHLCPESELMRQEGTLLRNEPVDLNVTEELPDMQTDNNSDVLYKVQQNTQSKDEMLQILQNLNETQMKVFYVVREWCLKKNFGENPDPLQIFITGGAGTGKSHLIKSIHYESSRILGKNLTLPDSVAVLLSAFTGTAAFNIGGNTIHHLFSLPKCMRLPYEPLGEQRLSEMRVQLGDLKILIIDEVSMVYKNYFSMSTRD